MNITAVEPRRKGLSALYIDGEYALKLDTEVLISNRFDVGRDISDEELKAVIDASDTKRCKDKALWLISYRDHSEKELFDKLCRDYSKEAAAKAVQRCIELGLIDDRKYAFRYASDLINIKRLSVSGARSKLIMKGIDRETADEVLSSFDVDEDEQARNIIERKYLSALSTEKGRRRAFSALTRMGYSYSVIKSAMNEYIDTEEY